MIIKVIAKDGPIDGRIKNKYLEASFIFFGSKRKAFKFIHAYYSGYAEYEISFIPEEIWVNSNERYAFDLSEYKGKALSKDRAYGMEYTVVVDNGRDVEYFSGRQPRIADYI